MRRVKDAERLTHRFMVNCTTAQHDMVMAEAHDSGWRQASSLAWLSARA